MKFPDQTVSDSERNKNKKQWFKDHIDYAHDLINSTSSHYRRLDKLYKEFKGKYSTKKYNEFVERYKTGERNLSKAKFIDYKLAQGKIDRLVGEYLKRPIKPIVISSNKDAVSKKMDKMAMAVVMSKAAPNLQHLRDNGVEVMGGLPIVPEDDPDYMAKINPKTQNEKFGTLLIQEQIKRLDLKNLGAKTLQDICISSECHATAEIKPNKKVNSFRIHPKDAVYQELEFDTYVKRSAIVGYREEFTIPEIEQRFHLNAKERDKLKSMEGNEDLWRNDHIKYMERFNNRLVVWSTKVFWFTTRKIKEKYIPGKNNVFIDFYEKVMSMEYYEKNKAKIESDVKAGKYEIRDSYTITIYETRVIGNDIYREMREQPYIIRSDADDYGLFYNYTGLIMDSVDGIKLSLMEKLEDLNDMYNVVMWQIRREIGRNKGTATFFDEAFLKKGQSANDVLFNLSEEGIAFYNSQAEENQANRHMETAGISSAPIGDVNHMQGLLQLKTDIQMMIDRISGINEMREGDIAATQTATGTMEGITASRTITTPIFYYHNKFMENLLTRVLEQTKYAIAYLKDDSFDNLIGDDGVSMIQKSKDFHLDEYMISLEDPNKEAELRQKMTQYGMAAVNAGEIKIHDVMRAEMAPTLQDADQLLEEGFKKMQEFQKQMQDESLQSQERNVQAQRQMMAEDREDKQAHDKEMLVMEKKLDSGLMAQDGANKQELQNSANQTPS